MREYRAMLKELIGLMAAVGYMPDVIVGLGRGGFHPATDLALHMDVRRLIGLEIVKLPDGSRLLGNCDSLGDLTEQRVLIVDDSTISGSLFVQSSAEVRRRKGKPNTATPIVVGTPSSPTFRLPKVWETMPTYEWELPL